MCNSERLLRERSFTNNGDWSDLPFEHDFLLTYKFEKHAREFVDIGMNFPSERDYQQAADDFMSGTVPEGARECERPNGEQLRFHRHRRILGVKAASGYLKTFYRPSLKSIGWGYFEYECKRTDIP